MKTPSTKPFLHALIAAAVLFNVTRVGATGAAIYFHDPTNVFVSPGLSFFTTLRVTATDKIVGAFSVLLTYDTNALQIQRVVPAPGSSFRTNVFADSSSFQSGATRIVGFQTSGTGPSATGQPACFIVWRTIGNFSGVVQIGSTIEKHITPEWQTEQVWALSSKITSNDTDSDHDGIPDGWMLQYFGHSTGDARDHSRAQDDVDGDGASNLAEYLAGTSPTDPSQVLRIVTMELFGSDVRLSFPTVPARAYQAEWSEDVARGAWATLGGMVMGSGLQEVVTDTGGFEHPARFYRVRVSP